MSVFAVFLRDRMIDPEEFEIYAKKARAARAGHELKPHVFYGALDVLEGPPVDGAVILEFPDRAAALAWYESPAYQEAKAHRLKAAEYRVILVESL